MDIFATSEDTTLYGSTTSCGTGTSITYAGGSGVGLQETLFGVTENPLEAISGTTVIGTVAGSGYSSAAGEPDGILILFKNNGNSAALAKKASKIYNKYDKNHNPEKIEGSTLIAISSETKQISEEIISLSTKKEILKNIQVLNELLKMKIENEEKEKKEQKIKK